VSHTGFTGTSLALDPAAGLWLVLLTNAVHASRDHTAVQALRRAVHAAAGVT
jgi:CubicO group peptidase (beta-lactamase class C family)